MGKKKKGRDRYKEGYRDGKKKDYNPPHNSWTKPLTGWSDKETKDRVDYKQGYRHDRKDRKKKK